MELGDRSGTDTKDPRKHAVILSGGGAKGAYEIGVMKALIPGYARTVSDGMEIHPVVYTGTSVGSYNAAYMTSRTDLDSKTAIAELEGIWRNRIASSATRTNGVLRFRANPLDVLDIDRMLADPFAPLRHFFQDGAFFTKDAIERTELFFKSQERLTRRVIQLIDFSAFISTDKLADLIRETIDLPRIRKNEERKLIVAATNWEKGAVNVFGNLEAKGEFADIVPLDDKIGHLAILASTAIPGVFPPVEIYHTKYVDGGLLLNTPLGPALRALRVIAPDEPEYVVHVIYLDPDLRDVPLEQGNNTMDTLNRFNALSFASQVNRDIKRAKNINLSLELPGADVVMETLTEKLKLVRGLQKDACQKVSALVRRELEKAQGPIDALGRGEPKHRPITIHRYHPRSTLGGIFGLLAFESDYVSRLMEFGFQDAVTHDCLESGCIFPRLRDVRTAEEASRGSKARAARAAAEITA